jgi:hypothetical protein
MSYNRTQMTLLRKPQTLKVLIQYTLIHVICIQETFLKSNKTFKFPDYCIVRKYHLNSNICGLLILIKNNIPFNTLELAGDIEIIEIEIHLKKS